MFTTILALTGALSGLGALALGGYVLFRTREADNESRKMARRTTEAGASGVDPFAVRDVALFHYDALDGMAGARSFSLALLNYKGDGVVLTSINGRTETRTYAKQLVGGESDVVLSPEEYRAVRSARLGEGIGATSENGGDPARPERSAPSGGRAEDARPADAGRATGDAATEAATDEEGPSRIGGAPGGAEGSESFVSVIHGPGTDERGGPDEEASGAGGEGTDAPAGRPAGRPESPRPTHGSV